MITDDGLAERWEPGPGTGRDIESRDEQPVLSFSRCHITIHLLVEDEYVAESAKDRSDTAIDSYERDMLAYAYRNRRPFRTHRIGEPRRITVIFPSLLQFVSEDTEVHLRASGALEDRGRRADLDVSTCVTWFSGSGRGVLHITFSPAPGFELNEYDLLKFVKLWEGGECLTPPIAFRAGGQELGPRWPQGIQDPNDPELTCLTHQLLTALARWALAGVPARPRIKLLESSAQPGASHSHLPLTDEVFCVGTLDLLDEDQSVQELLSAVTKLLERPNDYAEVVNAMADDKSFAELPESFQSLVCGWQRLVAIGGLIQGLLDFVQIGVDELRDVFATVLPTAEQPTPSQVSTHALTAIHKGTLLSVAPNTERARSWKTKVNPYLAIAHSVALYNEERMLQARQSALAAVHRRGGASLRGYPPMTQARLCLGQANEQLEQFVPNVFVYPSERQIYETCHQTRAIEGLRDDAKEQLELSRNLVEYRERKHGAAFAIIALVLGLIASVEGYFIRTKELVTEPLVALVAVGLFPLMVYAIFYFWRRHH